MALVFLVVFMVMGGAYLRIAALDMDRTQVLNTRIRARQAAVAGIHAGIGELQAVLASGDGLDALLQPEGVSLNLPAYDFSRGIGLIAVDGPSYVVSMTFSDENARVNINHAPPAVLASVLHVEGETARQIRASLPHDGAGAAMVAREGRRWFNSVDELVSRGLLTAAQFDAVDRNLLTVYSVPNPQSPSAYINVNSAPAPVLAAVLDIPVEQAALVAEARPFATLAELSAAAGKDPSAFGYRSDPSKPNVLPDALSFGSNCFRIRSEAVVKKTAASRMVTEHAEAVVVFVPGRSPRITYWSQGPGMGRAVKTAG